ncbi:MAG: hypothetical protein HF962_09020 [Sulfurovum sp.]|nr:hypothetical protein [Sulfurovum sp.]
MKRWRPRARGTATRILKPTAHIFVEVGVMTEESAKPVAKKETVKKETEVKVDTKKPAAKADDLTKIKGIGKVYAGKLKAEGIETFEAVSSMTKEQIDMMEEKYSFKGDFTDSIADAKNFVTTKEA